MDLTRSSTVDGIIRRSARTFGDRVALVFDDREWTYRELDNAVTRGAAHLLDRGLVKGDRVAALGRNSDAYLIGFLSCARAGLVHVPLNYNLIGDELAYLLEQSGSSIVLVDPDLSGRIGELGPSFDDRLDSLPLRDVPGGLLDIAAQGEAPQIDVDVEDGDVVQLLYTSGTTARPKGAMMTHRSLLAQYVSCLVGLDLRADDNPLHVMPLYHSAQMHVFLLPWLAIGARSTVLEVPDPGEILRRIEQDGHRAFFAAPTLWVALTNHADFVERDLSALTKAYYGASIMPGPVVTRLMEKMPSLGLYNCFGQSEMGPLCTVLRPEEHAERPHSAGRAVLMTEMRVVDDDGSDVSPGEMGEVIYRSPQLCLGYWNKPDETAAAFVEGWFHSGDLVQIDDDGYITVVDRIKDVINTGGVLVASREVEDALFTHPAVAEAAVVGTADERWVEAVTAVVVLKDGEDEIGTDELIQHARARLASFKVPKAVHIVEELPKNTSGKILKRELRDRLS